MLNLHKLEAIKRITIILLILSLGLGFFVAQAPSANAAYSQRYFSEQIRDIQYADHNLFVSTSDISILSESLSLRDLDVDIDGCVSSTSCAPKIYSSVLGSDGRTLYFTGDFTRANGVVRNGLAAVDIWTGDLKSWNPTSAIDASEKKGKLTLSPSGSYIYYFDTYSTEYLPKIYRIDLSGAVTELFIDWGIEDDVNKWYSIQDIFISPNGRKFYINFDRIFPSRYTMHYAEIIEVDIGSGAVRTIHEIKPDDSNRYGGIFNMAMSPDGQTLYITGLSERAAGSTIRSHYLRVINIDSGSYRNVLLKRVDAAVSLNYNSYEDIFVSSITGRVFIILETMYSTSGDAYINDDSELVIGQPFTTNAVVEVDPGDGENASIGLPNNFISGECAISDDEENIFVSGVFYTGAPRSSDYETSYAVVKQSLAGSYLNASTQSSGTTVTATDNDFLTGELVKEIGKPAVYLLREGYKHPILSAQVFEAYGWRWEDVTEHESLAAHRLGPVIGWPASTSLREGSLIKSDDSSRVYVISNGMKRWIRTETIFSELGYRFSDVITVSDSQFNSYSTGSEISDLYHPDGALIKYPSDPRVWLIEDGQKRLFPNEWSFTNGGYRWDMILTIMPTLTYPDGPSM